MNRSTAAGNFFLAVVSVMTEISDETGQMSTGNPPRKKPRGKAGLFVHC
jgi:hypothetical protein